MSAKLLCGGQKLAVIHFKSFNIKGGSVLIRMVKNSVLSKAA